MIFRMEDGEKLMSSSHRGPDQRVGVTAAEIARMSGAVTRPTAASIAARAGVPGHDVRRGISPDNGRRLAIALSVGLLSERSARALAEDPQAFLNATYDLQDLVREIMRARDEESKVIAVA